MRWAIVLAVVVAGLLGCSSEDKGDKALDSASPMSNVPSPPPPANKPRMALPGASGGAAPASR